MQSPIFDRSSSFCPPDHPVVPHDVVPLPKAGAWCTRHPRPLVLSHSWRLQRCSQIPKRTHCCQLSRGFAAGILILSTNVATISKTYPEALCRAIAALWSAKIAQSQPCVQEDTFLSEFVHAIEELHSAIGESVQGRTFAVRASFRRYERSSTHGCIQRI